MYGSLTYGGEPLKKDATLEFPGGVGFATERSGEYRAATLEPIAADDKLEVATCDGTLRAVVLAERSARGFGRFDVDVPDNELTINVTDTFTTMSLSGATVTVTAMAKTQQRAALTRRLKTGATGAAEMKSVPPREIHLAVTLSGYEKARIPPFTMPRSEKKVIDVQLVPVRDGSGGRIVSPKPFDTATVYWFSPAGHRTEAAEVAPDGTFVFTHRHGPDETMSVVSASHPLWLRRAPPTDPNQTLELRFPDAPSRTFDVVLRTGGPAVAQNVGLAIGGLRVPFLVLREHLALREAPVLHFPDIAETDPIDVVLDRSRKRLPPGTKQLVLE